MTYTKNWNWYTVLMNIASLAKNNADDEGILRDALDAMLDELLENDFFGTEGQLDPRGDHRE